MGLETGTREHMALAEFENASVLGSHCNTAKYMYTNTHIYSYEHIYDSSCIYMYIYISTCVHMCIYVYIESFTVSVNMQRLVRGPSRLP